MTTATRITAAQYYELTVEGDRKQLVDGQIVVSEPKFIHGVLQFRLAVGLGKWIERGERRGQASMPTNVSMDKYNVYGPDLLWFREDRIPKDLNAYPEHVPDLCVEIRSSSTWRFDVARRSASTRRADFPSSGWSTIYPTRCSPTGDPNRARTPSTWRSSTSAPTRSIRQCCPASSSRWTSCSGAERAR